MHPLSASGPKLPAPAGALPGPGRRTACTGVRASLFALSLSVLPETACIDLGNPEDYEVGCVDDVTMGEDADEEDLARGLAVIPCIDGNLFIDNTLARRIDLPSLVEVGGTLAIAFNVGLNEIDLPRLRRVGGDFTINRNPSLEVLSVPALREVLGDVEIIGNEALSSCEASAALAGIVLVGGDVQIDPPALDCEEAAGPGT